MSTASKRHLERVAGLACACCGVYGVQVHHMREDGCAGGAQRAGDWLTIPLCPECHTGTHGVHGDRLVLRRINKDQHTLLDETLEALYGR